ncbi:hypothetical protein FRUB_03579 [Fimbriiglobus ruber]|uniref:Uncharacterized protein n=1 Tax=Fimbriiglobus ruber TaxID=1908690 RepID=A0A225DR62_9BACT|nr:hypothetical protein FRUB_03579 [Fimbriiglobus ruber]
MIRAAGGAISSGYFARPARHFLISLGLFRGSRAVVSFDH